MSPACAVSPVSGQMPDAVTAARGSCLRIGKCDAGCLVQFFFTCLPVSQFLRSDARFSCLVCSLVSQSFQSDVRCCDPGSCLKIGKCDAGCLVLFFSHLFSCLPVSPVRCQMLLLGLLCLSVSPLSLSSLRSDARCCDGGSRVVSQNGKVWRWLPDRVFRLYSCLPGSPVRQMQDDATRSPSLSGRMPEAGVVFRCQTLRPCLPRLSPCVFQSLRLLGSGVVSPGCLLCCFLWSCVVSPAFLPVSPNPSGHMPDAGFGAYLACQARRIFLLTSFKTN